MTRLIHKGDKSPPPLLCSICQLPILPEGPTGWNGGHNAQPINDGQCCAHCDNAVVQPARINLLRMDALLRHEAEKQAAVLRGDGPKEPSPRRETSTLPPSKEKPR